MLVVGAGALGNEVIKNLALLGVGRLTIVDRDCVEASNLTRSILFCTPSIDLHLERRTPKAELAALRVREINPDIEVSFCVSELADVGLGRIRRADLVFSCVDNEMARLETAWACTRLNKPLADGGLGIINYSSGLVSIFPGSEGPCYACRKGPKERGRLLSELHGREDPCWLKEEQLGAVGVVATTPLMASVVGAIQVELGLRAYWGGALGKRGEALRISLAPQSRLDRFAFERSPHCPLHEPLSLIGEVVELAMRSDRQTPRDLFEAFERAEYLCLDWPVTNAAKCLACGHEWSPRVRRSRFRGQSCPDCGSQDLAETLVLDGIARESEWAGVTFAELGLPPAHIHELALGRDPGAERVHVEISGDLEMWEGETEKTSAC